MRLSFTYFTDVFTDYHSPNYWATEALHADKWIFPFLCMKGPICPWESKDTFSFYFLFFLLALWFFPGVPSFGSQEGHLYNIYLCFLSLSVVEHSTPGIQQQGQVWGRESAVCPGPTGMSDVSVHQTNTVKQSLGQIGNTGLRASWECWESYNSSKRNKEAWVACTEQVAGVSSPMTAAVEVLFLTTLI